MYSNTSHYQSQRHSSYFALNTLMVNVGKWATDTHHATTRLRRTSRAYRFDNDNTASSPPALWKFEPISCIQHHEHASPGGRRRSPGLINGAGPGGKQEGQRQISEARSALLQTQTRIANILGNCVTAAAGGGDLFESRAARW